MSRLLLVLGLFCAVVAGWSAETGEAPTDATATDPAAAATVPAESTDKAATTGSEVADDGAATEPTADDTEGEAEAAAEPLPDPSRTLIQNERIAVSLSDWRASIGHVAIKGMKPLELPDWRNVDRKQPENEGEDPQDWRLQVLDHEFHNPKFAWDPLRHGWGLTDMHNYVWSAGLEEGKRADGSYGPLEGLWELRERTATSAVYEHVDEGFGLTYRMTYRMDAERPTVHVSYEIINHGDVVQDLGPKINAINGVYQDDPGHEDYDLAVIYNFGGGADGFDYASLPDVERDGNNALIPVVVKNPNGEALLDPEQLRYVGFKSRFFAAWWKPAGVDIVEVAEAKEAEEAAQAEATEDEAGTSKVVKNKSLREAAAGTEMASGDSDYRIKAEALGFWQLNDEGEPVAQHGSLQIILMPSSGSAFTIEPGEKLVANWSITATSLDKDSLATLTESEQQVEYADWWYRFFKILVAPLNWLLRTIGDLVGHYGVAIIVLVLLIKGALHKLNVKTQTSMMKMQKLGPELKRIQERYKNDKQTLAMKQMELFKKEGVNPVGGCLPMLIQMPVFVALYQTFRHSADMRGQGFLWVNDLTLPDQVFHLFGPVTLNILPLLYIGVSLWISFSSKPPAAGQVSDQQRQMQMMMRWMPVLFGVIFYNMPAGLVLYFVLSAIFSAVEMRYIRKRLGVSGGGIPTM